MYRCNVCHIMRTPAMQAHDVRYVCVLCEGGQGPCGGYTLYIHVLLHRSVKYTVNHYTHNVVYIHVGLHVVTIRDTL